MYVTLYANENFKKEIAFFAFHNYQFSSLSSQHYEYYDRNIVSLLYVIRLSDGEQN